MPHLTLTFDTRQQLACARSACRRMLAAPLPLAAYQRAALTSTLAMLNEQPHGAGEVVLDADQQAALATALQRLQQRHVRSLPPPHLADTAIAAVAARLTQITVWTLPNMQVVQFVRLGYGDKHNLPVRSLDFRIDMPDRPTFECCLTDAIAAFHRFNGTQVAAAFGPRWDQLSTLTLGRGPSPVIDLAIPFTRDQQNGGDTTHSDLIPDAEREALAETIWRAATSCHADAILFADPADPQRYDARPSPPRRVPAIRLWWV